MPSLLFVHGAWHGAWCWEDNLLPWFRARGHEVAAVTLRQHGGGDTAGLRRASIDDYVADLTACAAQLPAPLVVVGHSMGGLVVQRWLLRHRPAGAVLCASAPVGGTAGALARTTWRHPVRVGRCLGGAYLRPLVETESMTRELFFTPRSPATVVRRCHERVQDESFRALIDMTLLRLPRPARVSTPMLVIGATEDGVFTPREVWRTARAYGVEPVMVGGGHDVMLDQAWELVASTIQAWVLNLPGWTRHAAVD